MKGFSDALAAAERDVTTAAPTTDFSTFFFIGCFSYSSDCKLYALRARTQRPKDSTKLQVVSQDYKYREVISTIRTVKYIIFTQSPKIVHSSRQSVALCSVRLGVLSEIKRRERCSQSLAIALCSRYM
ncbi:protein of unknown function [Methylocaldum szegediense]|uniref:Uncharacterized protein n=1 Tax=Methylocaldum szegediense TaxID=73780 RepID=A0ABN8X2U6_9GAMM|nr:protein of unknown function [Methylocaldum szegediense]